MYNLQNILAECKKELDKIGIKYGESIEIKENGKMRDWGKTSLDDDNYTIEIANTLLDERNPKSAVKQTVMHELLHTCKNSFGHTGSWKVYANCVNRAYGYDIERINSIEDLGVVVDSRPAKYKLVCQKCGHIFIRQRECDLTKHPEHYHCVQCGGSIARVY